MDAVLEGVRRRADADADTLAVLLIGSRSAGVERPDSDYDLIWVLRDAALDAKVGRGDERHVKAEGLDILYTSIRQLAKNADEPSWYTRALLSARVLLDKTGEVADVLTRVRTTAEARARAQIDESYDSYLNGFVRSLKAWKRGDELGGRLHASESMAWLVRTLCGLVGHWPPYHDELASVLPELERAIGLAFAGDLAHIVATGDPTRQQQLERRVETLMSSRGVPHQWGTDLEPLQEWRLG